MVDQDKVIEVDFPRSFPLLWLHFQKLNLLANGKINMILKYRKDIIFTNDKLFIVDTRSSLKRAGGRPGYKRG